MADPYLIPGTDVLRNRLGITDAAVLADFEGQQRAALVGDHLRAVGQAEA